MSEIDFQNGFIVGMATRGLTISRAVIEGASTFARVDFQFLTPMQGVSVFEFMTEFVTTIVEVVDV